MLEKSRYAVAIGVALTMVIAGGFAFADATTMTSERQEAMTPGAALDALKAGNARFLSEDMAERDWSDQVEATATGQYPHSAIVGCIDSRVPPEIVFDQGIGDIFAARVAGNFVNTDIIGSLEFAAAVAGSKLIVVLGHTECGAVKGACDGVELGNLTHTLSNLSPALYAVQGYEGDRNAKNKEFVQEVTEANVRLSVENLTDRSDILAGLVEEGKLQIVGAIHDVHTGEVTFLED